MKLPELGCACATIRRASRLVTQLYGDEMGRKMEPTQFSTLSALMQQPGANQRMLAWALGLDKTTLSRNIRLMRQRGWVAPQAGADRRERGFKVTALGQKVLAAVKPGWERAQAAMRAQFGEGELEDLMKAINGVAEAAEREAAARRMPVS